VRRFVGDDGPHLVGGERSAENRPLLGSFDRERGIATQLPAEHLDLKKSLRIERFLL